MASFQFKRPAKRPPPKEEVEEDMSAMYEGSRYEEEDMKSSPTLGQDGGLDWATLAFQRHVRDGRPTRVVPLVMPDDCEYDEATGRMRKIPGLVRSALKVYPPALDFIRGIDQSKLVGVVSICGKARTGKSLVAGELAAPRVVPCPFDLGHTMDACTYGIWVALKAIPHPVREDVVVLVLDVEGTGFHEASKQQDMQLMVLSILASSLLIYNNKTTFDSAALDELQFMTELTQNIRATKGRAAEQGQHFCKFFPAFLWLLRDAMLTPALHGKEVTFKEYFLHRVLKSQPGVDARSAARESTRRVFMSAFAEFDAFGLAIPHFNRRKLHSLGHIAREELNPEFTAGLRFLCERQVMGAVEPKFLLGAAAKGKDPVRQACTGSMLAAWLEHCVRVVNDPDAVPDVLSLTDAVMKDRFQQVHQETLQLYQQTLLAFMGRGEDGRRKQKTPREVPDVLRQHGEVLGFLLESVGKELSLGADDEEDAIGRLRKQQRDKLFETIGHTEKASEMGKRGFLAEVLAHNKQVSQEFASRTLDQLYKKHCRPLLGRLEQEDGGGVTTEQVYAALDLLQGEYEAAQVGPCRSAALLRFDETVRAEFLRQFFRLKEWNHRHMAEREKARQRDEEAKRARAEAERQAARFASQKSTLDSMVDEARKRAERLDKDRAKQAQQHRDRVAAMKVAQLEKDKVMAAQQLKWHIKMVETQRESKTRMDELAKQAAKLRAQALKEEWKAKHGARCSISLVVIIFKGNCQFGYLSDHHHSEEVHGWRLQAAWWRDEWTAKDRAGAWETKCKDAWYYADHLEDTAQAGRRFGENLSQKFENRPVYVVFGKGTQFIIQPWANISFRSKKGLDALAWG